MMANHPIPIDSIAKDIIPHPISLCVPWGDTITVTFNIEADLVYVIQMPSSPPAFLPPIPTGHFHKGDVISARTAQKVAATTCVGYTDTKTGVSNTITIYVKQNCS
jgi:hypothetical protein